MPIDIAEFGQLAAEQMEAVEGDFTGRTGDFEFEGAVTILIYKDKAENAIGVRHRTTMCRTCTLKAVTLIAGYITDELPCLEDE